MVITVIENYLLSIDQATFQKLMDHLLHLEGYKFISSPGSVIGKNKTSKGSPDSFFEDGDDYVFCEYTTQSKLEGKKSFYKKLSADIAHCFNTAVTGIDKNRISKIILSCTAKVSPEEHRKLTEQTKQINPATILIIYSIQEIPFRLIYYPGLTEKYIPGVKTTNSLIYTLPDFLATTNKGIQPALTNPFSGRSEEIEQAKNALLSHDLLVITGPQGVGKSKIATRIAEIFETEFDYETRVIVSSPVPLWDDLSTFILPGKKYIIFFDDANKALPNLDYLLQFVKGKEKDAIKIVITIRDYVRQYLSDYLLNHSFREISINPFEKKDIKDMIEISLPDGVSVNPQIMEYILTLSKGNSRLALMATTSILKNDNVDILKDVVSLYDQYFQNIKSELKFLNNNINLKALGILSFFGVLDRNNLKVKTLLEENFNINWNQLWETLVNLEQTELVDIFANETAKISDQILASYVFYKTFVDSNTAVINYDQWIIVFLSEYQHLLNRTFIDTVNTFGFESIKDQILGKLIKAQDQIKSDPKKMKDFFTIFWAYRQHETLVFVQHWVKSLSVEKINLESINYEANNGYSSWVDNHFNLLTNFYSQNTPFVKQALELTMEFLFKCPSRVPDVLKILKEHLQFKRFDYMNGYARQLALIEVLSVSYMAEREQTISDNIFLKLAPSKLGWEYTQTQGDGGRSIQLYNFSLANTQDLIELRKIILARLFLLFKKSEVAVLSALRDYIRFSRGFGKSAYINEQQEMEKFIVNNLNPTIYSHSLLVLKYSILLKAKGIAHLNDFKNFLNSDCLRVAEVFGPKIYDSDLKYEEAEKLQKENIRAYITDKDIVFIENTLDQLNIISLNARQYKNEYWIETSISHMILALADINIGLYCETIGLLKKNKYSFHLYSNFIYYPIVNGLLPLERMYTLIDNGDYSYKDFWKQIFFEAINESDINEFFLDELIKFINSIKHNCGFYSLHTYFKFNAHFNVKKIRLPISANSHENIITYIVEILLSKTKDVKIQFDYNICEKNYFYFKDKLELLKQVFFYNAVNTPHYNHDGKEMVAISFFDPRFLVEFLKKINHEDSQVSLDSRNIHLDFIWELAEYENILDDALIVIMKKNPSLTNWEHQANILFKGSNLSEANLEKMYAYISKFVSKYHKSIEHIHIIFNVITYSFNNRILHFLREFLLINTDVEFIKRMYLDKNEVFSSSRVPRIEARMKFFKSLIDMVLTFPDSVNYSKHIEFWNMQILYAEEDKKREMKSDFAEMY